MSEAGFRFLVLVLATPVLLLGVTALLNTMRPMDSRKEWSHVTPFKARRWVGAIGYAALLALLGRQTLFLDGLAYAAYYFIILNLFTFINWFVFTITDVSMHVRLLAVLREHGPMTEEEILRHYNRRSIIRNRIPRLLTLKQLELRDGRYFLIGEEVLKGAAVCGLMRRLLGIPVEPPADSFERDSARATRRVRAVERAG